MLALRSLLMQRLPPWRTRNPVPFSSSPCSSRHADRSPGQADDRPISEVMHGLRPAHPRLYVLDDEVDSIKEQVKVDPLCGAWYDRLQKDAERMIKDPVVVHRLIWPSAA